MEQRTWWTGSEVPMILFKPNGDLETKGRIEELQTFDDEQLIDPEMTLDDSHTFDDEDDAAAFFGYVFGMQVQGYTPADKIVFLSDGRVICKGIIEEGSNVVMYPDNTIEVSGSVKEDEVDA